MRRFIAIMVAATAFPAAVAAEAEPLFSDDMLGTQMTGAEMKAAFPGNSLTTPGKEGARIALHFPADGSLRSEFGGKRQTTRWYIRDYDNLFCFDTAGPCVQLLRKGDTVTVRRKDGLVEFAFTLMPGNPLNL